MGISLNTLPESLSLKPLMFLLVLTLSIGCVDSAPGGLVRGEISEYPENTKVNESFMISWWVSYPSSSNLTHTAVHYGYASHPGELGLQTNIAQSGYSEVLAVPSDILKEGFNFHAEITPQYTGNMYFRVHSIINGDNYWSEEFSVNVE